LSVSNSLIGLARDAAKADELPGKFVSANAPKITVSPMDRRDIIDFSRLVCFKTTQKIRGGATQHSLIVTAPKGRPPFA
jgi:hypothetical protein